MNGEFSTPMARACFQGKLKLTFHLRSMPLRKNLIWSHLILSDLTWESSDLLISHLIFWFLRWEYYFLIWACIFLTLPQMLIWFLIWFQFLRWILMYLNMISDNQMTFSYYLYSQMSSHIYFGYTNVTSLYNFQVFSWQKFYIF